jgi:cell division protein FtsA
MEGAVDLAEEYFHVPVRLGIPTGVSGVGDVVRNPMYATAVGLLLYGRQNMEPAGGLPPLAGKMSGVLNRLKGWLAGHI